MTIEYPRLRWLGAVLLAAALAGCGAAKPQQNDALAPPSQSVLEADARLARVALDRSRAEAAFAAAEQHCYTRFMVNNCLDKAREQRRATLSRLRAIEIEAERFLRQAKVEERDRALATAEAQFQAEQAAQSAQTAQTAQTAMAAAPPARAAPPALRPLVAAGVSAKPGVAHQKAAAQAAKLKNRAAEDRAGASKRAANVQAFEQRKRNAQQRQQEIAQKKTDRNKKAESEAAAK